MTHLNIIPVNIEEEMKSSFLDYSMSVIISRALPDVRDGLKPVHRRIFYAMQLLKNFHNRPYLKSARVVGEVIGRFHPHGDSAVYEALVRMAQDFSMRYPLVQGQGNFGSIDGDSAAAMRYTEVRFQRIAEQMMADIDKETVNFGPNYDNKEVEPLVLPTKIPTLLINGASGIAVGMATNIPPHNIGEVLDALEELIENPDITILDLMNFIKGPDFPTAGLIYGVSGIHQAYMTGRGSIVMRARASVEPTPGHKDRERIIIAELPYQVNKAKLIEKIAELINEGKIEGISDIRDESAQSEIRVVIELKRGEVGEIVLNNLYKQTQMQSSFGVNMVALMNSTPKLMNLKLILEQFYLHRQEVILRKTAFELRKAEERAHILLGLKVAVENLDAVVKLIRNSPDSTVALQELMIQYDLTEIQGKAILDMRLARLTGLEREKIVAEYLSVMEQIADLKDILETPGRVTEIIKEEIKEQRANFGDGRKTEIIGVQADDFSMESLVADEEVVVTITNAGYIKRTALDETRAVREFVEGNYVISVSAHGLVKKTDIMQYSTMRTTGIIGLKLDEGDSLVACAITTGDNDILIATKYGKAIRFKETNIRPMGRSAKGVTGIRFGEEEDRVIGFEVVKSDNAVLSVCENGYGKRTPLEDYRITTRGGKGIFTIKVTERNGPVVGIMQVAEDDDLMVMTSSNKIVRFTVNEVGLIGRVTQGVKLMTVEPGEKIISLARIARIEGEEV